MYRWIVPRSPFLLALLLLIVPAAAAAGDEADALVGRWEGEIATPLGPSPAVIDFDQDDKNKWRGYLDVQLPMIKFSDLEAYDFSVNGGSVSFRLPVPGYPLFVGDLSADGKTLSGNTTKEGQSEPFVFTKTSDEPVPPDELDPEVVEWIREGVPVAGEGLAGAWRSALIVGSTGQRMQLNFLPEEGGGYLGTMDLFGSEASMDMGLSEFSFEGRQVAFTVPMINGVFRGTMNKVGSNLTGTWSQTDHRDFSLIFRRQPPK
jgi:hypothetical protein